MARTRETISICLAPRMIEYIKREAAKRCMSVSAYIAMRFSEEVYGEEEQRLRDMGLGG